MPWSSGMLITAARLEDHTPVPLASVPTAAAGFSVASFSARKAGGNVEFTVVLSRTGASLAPADAGGNIVDIVCCTMPSDCWPGATYITQFDKGGTASGSLRISTSGVVTLTSMDPTSQIAISNTINFSGSFATG